MLTSSMSRRTAIPTPTSTPGPPSTGNRTAAPVPPRSKVPVSVPLPIFAVLDPVDVNVPDIPPPSVPIAIALSDEIAVPIPFPVEGISVALLFPPRRRAWPIARGCAHRLGWQPCGQGPCCWRTASVAHVSVSLPVDVDGWLGGAGGVGARGWWRGAGHSVGRRQEAVLFKGEVVMVRRKREGGQWLSRGRRGCGLATSAEASERKQFPQRDT